jgi:multidrug resistance efflux pump
MTWLRNVRPLLFVLGGLLVVGSLLGARLLAHGSGGGAEATAKTAAPTTNGRDGSGPVVIGYADSDPPPVEYRLPPVLQAGEVVAVYVRQGDEVKVREFGLFGRAVKLGDPLYKFDTTIQERARQKALAAVNVARAKVKSAEGMKDEHAKKINLQAQALAAADLKVNLALDAWKLGVATTKEAYRLNKFPESEWDDRLSKDVKIFELYSTHESAKAERNGEQAKLDALRSANMDLLIDEARANVTLLEAEVDTAQATIDLCTVRAKQPGTVEQVYVSKGSQLGISTRTPAVVLVPAGPRVVRAEVEAEFAHRVGQDKVGKEVTIYDHTDPKLTYRGKVVRIPTTFLPKRSSEGGFVPNETRVLEAVIEVIDPNPPGKPPLRVGQKVRVNFGQ